MNIEAVCECQSSAFFQVRRNFVFIHGGLVFIGQQNHDNVCFFGGICNAQCFKAGSHRFVPRRALTQTNHHIHAGIFQVGRVGMALRTITDDGHRFAFYQ